MGDTSALEEDEECAWHEGHIRWRTARRSTARRQISAGCFSATSVLLVKCIELSIDYRIPAAAPRCGRASVSGSYTCLVSLRIALARAALTTPRCALWVSQASLTRHGLADRGAAPRRASRGPAARRRRGRRERPKAGSGIGDVPAHTYMYARYRSRRGVVYALRPV